MVTPMEDDGISMGPPPLHSLPVSHSKCDQLTACPLGHSRVEDSISTHLLAQCHNTGYDLCAQYIVHLAQGGNAGELSSQLPNLEQSLDEALPEEMA